MSAAGALTSGIFNAIGAGVTKFQLDKVKDNIEKQKAANEDLYNRRANEDTTQLATSMAALNRGTEALINRTNAANAMAAVSGASGESVARTKAANTMAFGNTVSDIAASGVARKDAAEANYIARNDQFESQLNNLQMQKAQNTQAAFQNAGDALGQAADSVAGAFLPGPFKALGGGLG